MICERMLRECGAAFPLSFIALRYFNAAGADPDCEIGECHVPETHVIPLLLDAAAGERQSFTIFGDDYPTTDGTCIRDYIHVSDLADAHVKAVRALLDGAESSALNLGTGRGWSIRELIASVREVTGREFTVQVGARRPGDPPSLVADAARARSAWLAATLSERRDAGDARLGLAAGQGSNLETDENAASHGRGNELSHKACFGCEFGSRVGEVALLLPPNYFIAIG